jgi:hypothetical protein
MLLGALATAEAAGVAAAALVHGTWEHRPWPGTTPEGRQFCVIPCVPGKVSRRTVQLADQLPLSPGRPSTLYPRPASAWTSATPLSIWINTI